MLTMIVGALVIGLTLGLLGSGGSILTVPVLVYLLGHQDKVAIAESLAIVGGIAAIGTLPYARTHQVDWRSVFFFGLPGMGGTYFGAWLAKFIPGSAQLVLFAGVMLLAAWMMFRRSKKPASNSDPQVGEAAESISTPPTSPAADADDVPHSRHPLWQIVLEGLVVGVLTGLVGVGGGFLIVPALVLLGGLPMRLAVGTSLAVIAMKSFSGFWKYLGVLDSLQLSVDWETIGLFLAVGVVGSIFGNLLGSRINQQRLRQVFAVFLVVMGVFVLGKEAPKLAARKPAEPPKATAESAAQATQPHINLHPAAPDDHTRAWQTTGGTS